MVADGLGLGQWQVHLTATWHCLCWTWEKLLAASHRSHPCRSPPLSKPDHTNPMQKFSQWKAKKIKVNWQNLQNNASRQWKKWFKTVKITKAFWARQDTIIEETWVKSTKAAWELNWFWELYNRRKDWQLYHILKNTCCAQGRNTSFIYCPLIFLRLLMW